MPIDRLSLSALALPVLGLQMLGLSALAGCTVQRGAEVPPAPVYSSASPYAQAEATTHAPVDGYCAEAVEEAQDAAARAAVTGRGRDAGRAARTAGYARRDC